MTIRKMAPAILEWTPICPATDCGFSMQPTRLRLNQALAVPTQCPRCLARLPTDDLAAYLLAARQVEAR